MTATRLKVASGGWVDLSAETAAFHTGPSVVLWAQGRPHVVPVDAEGCISSAAARQLEQRGLLGRGTTWTGPVGPELEEALLAPATAAEMTGIPALLGDAPQAGRGLHVGCGTGRLLVPLVEQGWQLDGLDADTDALLVADRRLRDLDVQAGEEVRLYGTSIGEFVSLSWYAYAFAALDTVQKLRTRWAFRTHLDNVRRSLQVGAPYLFCLRAVPRPGCAEAARWTVVHQGEVLEAVRETVAYDHVTDQVTERLTTRGPDGTSSCTRSTVLAGYRTDWVLSVIADSPDWQLSGCWNQDFEPVDPHAGEVRSLWFRLTRTGTETGAADLHPAEG